MIKMNKKGGEKLLSIWWFLVLAVIGLCIVGGVVMYYGRDVDTRAAEAEILASKVISCLSTNQYFDDEFLKSDILNNCGLSKESFESNGYFFFKVYLTDDSGKDLLTEEIKRNLYIGNIGYEQDCKVGESIDSPNYPKCVEKNLKISYLKDGNLINSRLRVVAGSNQFGGRF